MEMMPEIVLHCNHPSARLEYIANFLTGSIEMKFRVQISAERPSSATQNSVTIHYGSQLHDKAFNIYSCGLLEESGVKVQNPLLKNDSGDISMFPAPFDGFDLPFDVLSGIFYLLTRYEEYLPFIPDRFGRFEADQSLLYSANILEEPVIDQWLVRLKNELKRKFPSLSFPARRFRFQSTFDIDNPWEYKHKGFGRNTGVLFRNLLQLHFTEMKDRIRVLMGSVPDPFDVYDYIRQIEEKYRFRSLFFFLTGDYGGFDVNYALHSAAFKKMLLSFANERIIGIHPSLKSNHNFFILKSEMEYFLKVTGKVPANSRQHFLILKFPETYLNLIAAGIQDDYSMGYASAVGFRAGTTLPFRFYNIVEEKETAFTIHPFAAMDVTLKQYMNLDPDAALVKIRDLIKKTKQVNGTFTMLWHNESLSGVPEWKGWRQVFESIAESACNSQ